MNNFYLSYHSIGIFLVFILLFIQTIYLISKKDKKPPTLWLIGLFSGFSVMLMGYFFAYSYYHPDGAYHRYFTVFVLFANANMSGFAYYFPKNDFERESKIMIPTAFLIAFVSYIHFIYNTYSSIKYYNFDAHFYTFDFGATTAIFILILFLWPLVVLIRKTVLYSDYIGSWRNYDLGQKNIRALFVRFWIGVVKVINPIGKEAGYTRTFTLVILLLIIAAVSNVLNKNGILPYDYYAIFYSNTVMVICFIMLMAYINSSGESTSFMIKLVGISLVTVLLILGVLSNFTLSLSESDYDNQRMAEIDAYKENILKDDFTNFPEEINYVIREESGKDITDTSRDYEILFLKENISLDEDQLKKGDEKELNFRIRELYNKIAKKFPIRASSELKQLAIDEYKKTRQYRNLMNSQSELKTRHYREAGENFLYYDFEYKQYRYEIGYSYLEYRQHTHKNALFLFYLVLISTILIVIIFPKFFKSSLVNPLNNLLKGVHMVNEGNLNVVVEIEVQDEIGFLAKSFNSMVASISDAREELKNHAANLEDKVLERTKEVQDKMSEVNTLKIQQDGDYFLTSLLTRPLFVNGNQSDIIKTEFYILQKKKFEFRNRKSELGGDICITGNIRLGNLNEYSSYTVVLNGDAMGKSMQGAGGSLVMGVVFNSILARSSHMRVLDTTPEQWMTDVYNECNSVFKTFNGTMILSAVMALVEESTGYMYYWNAEHPFSVLYKKGKAEFIEESLELRKLGLESEFPFKVRKYKLDHDDMIIIASDGRDDIDLTPDEEIRTINEDERLFLSVVEEANGDIQKIVSVIQSKGKITDDLSILKIHYSLYLQDTIFEADPSSDPISSSINEIYEKNDIQVELSLEPESFNSSPELTSEDYSVEEKITLKEETIKSGDMIQAYDTFTDSEFKLIDEKKNNEYDENPLSSYKLKWRSGTRIPEELKTFGLISYKKGDYRFAEKLFEEYIRSESNDLAALQVLSLVKLKLNNFQESIRLVVELLEHEPNNSGYIVFLSELYAALGKYDVSIELLKRAKKIQPENPLIDELLLSYSI